MSEFVYVLSNPTMKGLLKIGYTAKSVEERMKELQTTGVPTPFKLEFQIETDDGKLLETYLHKMFSQYRFGSDREFFWITLPEIIKLIKEDIQSGSIKCISFGGTASSLYLTPEEKKKIQEAKKILEREKEERAEVRKKQAERKRLALEEAERQKLAEEEKCKTLVRLEKELSKLLSWLDDLIESKRKKETLINIIFSGNVDYRAEVQEIVKCFDRESHSSVELICNILHKLIDLNEYENTIIKLIVDSNKFQKRLANIFLFDRRVIYYGRNDFKLKGWNPFFLRLLSELRIQNKFSQLMLDPHFDTKYFYKKLKWKREKMYFKLLEGAEIS
jgi:T5orf172 domain